MRSAFPPLATKRQTISRSVRIPSSRLSSQTGMQPTLNARIFRAASRMESEGGTHPIGTDINSFTFIAILRSKSHGSNRFIKAWQEAELEATAHMRFPWAVSRRENLQSQ